MGEIATGSNPAAIRRAECVAAHDAAQGLTVAAGLARWQQHNAGKWRPRYGREVARVTWMTLVTEFALGRPSAAF